MFRLRKLTLFVTFCKQYIQGEFVYRVILDVFPLPIELQSLPDDIEPYLVPVFEAVGQGLLGIVNFHRYTIYIVMFDPLLESRTTEPENA
jgi:hypothetical protein